MNRLALAAAALALTAATACGGGGEAKGPARAIDVTMTDLKFDPATLSVARGESVTLRFRNDGKVAHDAFVGTAQEQQEHEAKAGKGGHDHGEDGGKAVTVQPGESGELRHTFDRAGTFEVGCHQPGHYGAGMKMTVTVA